ncbi:MAG: MurR/RpiR family transcriptional regulator [Spirochaetales bacterium]|nr:MurR/RpiR family transcriptional regulator [Spirochaetales bacterium]
MQSFLTLIEQIEKELPSSERRIADYVLQNPSAPLFMTMTELAAAAGSSPAIVVRLCKRLNVNGYSDFKIRLSREVFSNEGKEEEPEQVMDNFYDSGLGTRELIVQYIKFTSKNLANLESILDPKTVDAAADLIYRSKTVLLLGTGSAEVILNDLQYKLARLGKNVIYTKDVNLQIAQSYSMTEDMVAFGISYFGEDQLVNSAAKAVKDSNGKLITLTKIGHNHLSRLADVKLQIPASGYEYRTGSTLTRILQIFVTDVLYSAVLGRMSEEEKATVLRQWNFSVTHS